MCERQHGETFTEKGVKTSTPSRVSETRQEKRVRIKIKEYFLEEGGKEPLKLNGHSNIQPISK